VTLAEIEAIYRSAQAASAQFPAVQANPYAMIATTAADLAFALANKIAAGQSVDRPDSFPIEQWEALKAFRKSGSDYINEAQKANPLDPTKIIQPSP